MKRPIAFVIIFTASAVDWGRARALLLIAAQSGSHRREAEEDALLAGTAGRLRAADWPAGAASVRQDAVLAHLNPSFFGWAILVPPGCGWFAHAGIELANLANRYNKAAGSICFSCLTKPG